MAKTSQKQKILQFMKLHGSITPRDALIHCGCMRLGARIWELIHEDGIPIKMTLVKVQNADGSFAHVASYSLASEAVA